MAVVAEPVLKRCSRCGEWKDREKDFLWQWKKWRDRKYWYPRSECRLCAAKRMKAYKAKLRAEGKLKDAQKRWSQNRDFEAFKKYKREWYRMSRGDRLAYVWKKYRHELDPGTLPRELDSISVAAYFDRFLNIEDVMGEVVHTNFGVRQRASKRYLLNGSPMTETDTHRLERWRKGRPAKLTERQVDEISVRYDLPPWEAIEAGKMAA